MAENCTISRLWMLQRDRYPGYVLHFRSTPEWPFQILGMVCSQYYWCFLDIVDTLGWHLQRFRGISYRRAFMLTKFSHSPVHNTSFPYGMTLQRTLGKTHRQSWLYFNNTSPSLQLSDFNQFLLCFQICLKKFIPSSCHPLPLKHKIRRPLKANTTLENPPFSIGNTSSNTGFSLVILVFRGGDTTPVVFFINHEIP